MARSFLSDDYQRIYAKYLFPLYKDKTKIYGKMFFEQFSKCINELQDINYAPLIGVVSAKQGMGKSTLGIWLGAYIQPTFSIKKNIIWNNDDIQYVKSVYTKEKRQVIIFDEPVKWVDSRKSLSRERMEFLDSIVSARINSHATFLLFGSVSEVDKRFRDRLLDMVIYIIKRGLAAVVMPNPKKPKNRFDLERLFSDNNTWYGNASYSDLNRENVVCLFKWKPLPPKISTEYNEWKMKYNIGTEKPPRPLTIDSKITPLNEIFYKILTKTKLSRLVQVLGLPPEEIWECAQVYLNTHQWKHIKAMREKEYLELTKSIKKAASQKQDLKIVPADEVLKQIVKEEETLVPQEPVVKKIEEGDTEYSSLLDKLSKSLFSD